MSNTLRTLFAGLILATAASYGGCWDWSYPEELLNVDGPLGQKDAALDAVVDGGPVSGQVSSVVSLIGDIPEVIRAGAGPVDEFM